jgi:hypothetical protein
MCGIKNKGSVNYYLNQLAREGLVERGERYERRSIRLCGPSNFMRLPTRVTKSRLNKKKSANEKKAEAASRARKMPKAERITHEEECLERAVRLGKRNDAAEDPLHDRRGLFSSGRLTATKVG